MLVSAWRKSITSHPNLSILAAKLTQKNEVLAELMQEHVALKKALGEP